MSVLLDSLLALAANTPAQMTMLSSESVVILMFAQTLLINPYNWLDKGEDPLDEITPADLVLIEDLVSNIMFQITHPVIGTVFPYLTVDPPLYCLPCDGSVYLREDYPQLYAALDDAFIIDADTFFVPDMRNLTMVGAGDIYAMGDTGGEAEITLTVDQIPAHSHENTPHAHSEIGAVSAIINGGLEAPASAATPFPTTTGATSIAIGDTGGGEAHTNLQPYIALKYCIGAA